MMLHLEVYHLPSGKQEYLVFHTGELTVLGDKQKRLYFIIFLQIYIYLSIWNIRSKMIAEKLFAICYRCYRGNWRTFERPFNTTGDTGLIHNILYASILYSGTFSHSYIDTHTQHRCRPMYTYLHTALPESIQPPLTSSWFLCCFCKNLKIIIIHLFLNKWQNKYVIIEFLEIYNNNIY